MPKCFCLSVYTYIGSGSHFHTIKIHNGLQNFLGISNRATTILQLLGNEAIQFNTRGKKSEPGIRKQLNTDVKSTTKLNFFFKYINIFIYFPTIMCFCFSCSYFKHLQTLIVSLAMFL